MAPLQLILVVKLELGALGGAHPSVQSESLLNGLQEELEGLLWVGALHREFRHIAAVKTISTNSKQFNLVSNNCAKVYTLHRICPSYTQTFR